MTGSVFSSISSGMLSAEAGSRVFVQTAYISDPPISGFRSF